jgi:hypothetical protein
MNNSLIVYESPLEFYVGDHATKMYLIKNGMEITINNLLNCELIRVYKYLIKESNILYIGFEISCEEEIIKRGLENEI